jgi:hypothetical protein
LKSWPDLSLELEKHDIWVWAVYFSIFEKLHNFSLLALFCDIVFGSIIGYIFAIRIRVMGGEFLKKL